MMCKYCYHYKVCPYLRQLDAEMHKRCVFYIDKERVRDAEDVPKL